MNDREPANALGEKITGATTLTYADIFAYQRAHLLRSMAIFASISLVLLTFVHLLAMPAWDRAHAWARPQWGVERWLSIVAPIALTAVLVYLAILLLLGWYSFRRTPAANRDLTYEIDAEALRTRDGMGAELVLPWRMVREARVSSKLLILRLTSKAARFVPLRAFAIGDRETVIRLACQHAGE